MNLIKKIDGGMGTIFVCNDRILERKVAIKFIQAHEENRRILDELNALMKVRSKHVVQVYDVIEDNERGLGIVQEYIYGNDLSNYSPAKYTRFLLKNLANRLRNIRHTCCKHNS